VNKITISSLAIAAIGIGVALIITQTEGQAQQGKGKAPEALPCPSALANYPAVTEARLKNPGDGEWLIRRTYDGWGYSPLNQQHNVSKLKLVWTRLPASCARMKPRRWSTATRCARPTAS
jgi:hypothetical protein